MTVAKQVGCPYCGEFFETSIDTSAGAQQYIEDCHVCCRPIAFRTIIDLDGNLTDVEVHREDD
jgi:hypothetical protein